MASDQEVAAEVEAPHPIETVAEGAEEGAEEEALEADLHQLILLEDAAQEHPKLQPRALPRWIRSKQREPAAM
jgi:hypothetical protein